LSSQRRQTRLASPNGIAARLAATVEAAGRDLLPELHADYVAKARRTTDDPTASLSRVEVPGRLFTTPDIAGKAGMAALGLDTLVIVEPSAYLARPVWCEHEPGQHIGYAHSAVLKGTSPVWRWLFTLVLPTSLDVSYLFVVPERRPYLGEDGVVREGIGLALSSRGQ